MKKYKLTKAPVKLDKNPGIKIGSSKNQQAKAASIQITVDGALEDIRVSQSLEYNMSFLKEVFSSCCDIAFRGFPLGSCGRKCFAVYMNGMVNKEIVSRSIINPLISLQDYDCKDITENTGETVKVLENVILSVSDFSEVYLLKDAVKRILDAYCILFIEGCEKAISISAGGLKTRSISEAKIESVLRGPQEAFIEDVGTNVTMIRRRLKISGLKTEKFEIGKQSRTNVILAYVKGIADEGVIEEARRRLNSVNIDLILDSGQIQDFIEDDSLSPFPQMDVTERPDVCTAALAEGRFVILVDGTPFAIIAPTTFPYLFTSAEDYYNRYYFVTMAKIMRYAAFFIALGAPSLYIAITTFHPEMLPPHLLLSVVTARANVPFPALVEAFLLELTFEIIREVAIRLPGSISQALSIVGALVIGQISVQAGLVSPLMIIVVAVTGLSSFLIPKINSARQISVMRFPMMVLASTSGIFGLIMGGLLLLVHLVSLRSFGVPYLSPISPLQPKGLKETFIKLPSWALRNKPSYMESDRVKEVKK
ncbi:MAG: spore germination protein [Caulobacteraceae bacterium]